MENETKQQKRERELASVMKYPVRNKAQIKGGQYKTIASQAGSFSSAMQTKGDSVIDASVNESPLAGKTEDISPEVKERLKTNREYIRHMIERKEQEKQDVPKKEVIKKEKDLADYSLEELVDIAIEQLNTAINKAPTESLKREYSLVKESIQRKYGLTETLKLEDSFIEERIDSFITGINSRLNKIDLRIHKLRPELDELLKEKLLLSNLVDYYKSNMDGVDTI